MTKEKHIERHKLLHTHLDELFADYIMHHSDEYKFAEMPIMKLLTWSNEQCSNPTGDK